MFFSYKQPILLDGYDSAIVPHLLISYCCSVAKKLSVNFDCALKFDQQISSVVKTNRVVQAFITACLGYCNSYVCSDQSSTSSPTSCSKCSSTPFDGKETL